MWEGNQQSSSVSFIGLSSILHFAVFFAIIYFAKDSLLASGGPKEGTAEVTFESSPTPTARTPQKKAPEKKFVKAKIRPVSAKKKVKKIKTTRPKRIVKRSAKKAKNKNVIAKSLPKKEVAAAVVSQEEAPVAVVTAATPQSAKPAAKTAVLEKYQAADEVDGTDLAEPLAVEDSIESEVENADEDFMDDKSEEALATEDRFEDVSDVDENKVAAFAPTPVTSPKPAAGNTGRGGIGSTNEAGVGTSSGKVRDYRLLKQRPGNRPPVYPSYARQAGAQGTVVLTYDVSRSGQVYNMRVVQSSGNRYLDSEAVRAISRYRYVPGQQGKTVHPVNFTLKNRTGLRSSL